MQRIFGQPISIETSSTFLLQFLATYYFLLQNLNNMDTTQSTLSYCQSKLHSLTDLHEDIVTLVSGLQNHDCSNCASKIIIKVIQSYNSPPSPLPELSWKLMMSEIINSFSIEFIKREKEKMELLLHDIAAQTVVNRSNFGGSNF